MIIVNFNEDFIIMINHQSTTINIHKVFLTNNYIK